MHKKLAPAGNFTKFLNLSIQHTKSECSTHVSSFTQFSMHIPNIACNQNFHRDNLYSLDLFCYLPPSPTPQ